VFPPRQLRHRTDHKKQTRAEHDKCRRKAVRKFLQKYLFDMARADCGESDIRCLDFDHIYGDEKFNISQAWRLRGGLETLKAELEKCIVRCSNCHRKQHFTGRFKLRKSRIPRHGN